MIYRVLSNQMTVIHNSADNKELLPTCGDTGAKAIDMDDSGKPRC